MDFIKQGINMEGLTKEILESHFEQLAQCTSHTLSDPVRKIITLCDNVDKKDYSIKNIAEEAHQLLNIIKHIRQYAFLVLQNPSYTIINTKNIIDEACHILKDKAISEENIGHNLSNAPEFVGDCAQITDAFVELIENAIKFSDDKKVIITYTEGNDSHIFSFANIGEKINQIYLKNIFYLSIRGNNSAGIIGNGIGLACVKAVAENHKGRAWAETSKDGNIFFLSVSKDLVI
jgi:light-regulated signal transduction histidine kinase (bacteriophytochrome)